MKILICDDSLNSVEATKELILSAKSNCKFEVATDQDSSFTKLYNIDDIDAVVLEPKIFINTLKKFLSGIRRKNLKIIFSSSDIASESIEWAYQNGVDLFLKKPYPPQNFFRKDLMTELNMIFNRDDGR